MKAGGLVSLSIDVWHDSDESATKNAFLGRAQVHICRVLKGLWTGHACRESVGVPLGDPEGKASSGDLLAGSNVESRIDPLGRAWLTLEFIPVPQPTATDGPSAKDGAGQPYREAMMAQQQGSLHADELDDLDSPASIPEAGARGLDSVASVADVGATGPKKGLAAGVVMARMAAIPPSVDGVLTVLVQHCSNLIPADKSGSSDPFARIALGTADLKTGVRKKTLEPVFNESFEFAVAAADAVSADEGGAHSLVVSVWDQDKGTSDDYLGEVTVNICEVFAEHGWVGAPISETRPLSDPEELLGDAENQKVQARTATGDLSPYGTISLQLSFAAAPPTMEADAPALAPSARQPAASAAADSSSPRVARKAELKAELQAMKPTALRKRAIAGSVDKDLLDDALDSDNPKEALVELVLRQTLKAESKRVYMQELRQSARQKMKTELEALKPTGLHKQALAAGIDVDLLDDALDSDTPKAALVEVLLDHLVLNESEATDGTTEGGKDVLAESAQRSDSAGDSLGAVRRYNLIVASSLFEGKRKCIVHASSLLLLESAIEGDLGLGQPIRIFLSVNRGALTGFAEVTDILDIPLYARVEVHPPEPCRIDFVFDHCDETGAGTLGPFELEQAAEMLGVSSHFISEGMTAVLREMKTDENDEVTKADFCDYWKSAAGIAKLPHLVIKPKSKEKRLLFEGVLVRNQGIGRVRMVRSVQAATVAELGAGLSQQFRLFDKITIWSSDTEGELESLDDLDLSVPIEIGAVAPGNPDLKEIDDDDDSIVGEGLLPDLPPPPPGRPSPPSSAGAEAGKLYNLLVSSLMFSGSRLCTVRASSLEQLHQHIEFELKIRGPLTITFEHPAFHQTVQLTDIRHLPAETRIEVTPAAISAEVVGRLRDIWAEIDTGSTGTMTQDDIEEMSSNLGVLLNPREISETLRDLDTDSDGQIDFGDFCSWWVDEGGAGSKRLRKSLSEMLQHGRPLRREFEVLISSVDDSLFAGKRNLKIVAGNKEQLGKRIAVKLGINETLRVFFFDAQFGERQLLVDLDDLPLDARVEVEAVGYAHKAPDPATAPTVLPPPPPIAAVVEVPPMHEMPRALIVVEDSGPKKTYNLLVESPLLAKPQKFKTTCGSLQRLYYELKHFLETDKSFVVHFDDPDFGERVELNNLDDLPQVTPAIPGYLFLACLDSLTFDRICLP